MVLIVPNLVIQLIQTLQLPTLILTAVWQLYLRVRWSLFVSEIQIPVLKLRVLPIIILWTPELNKFLFWNMPLFWKTLITELQNNRSLLSSCSMKMAVSLTVAVWLTLSLPLLCRVGIENKTIMMLLCGKTGLLPVWTLLLMLLMVLKILKSVLLLTTALNPVTSVMLISH